MPALTRRLENDLHREAWSIFYDDIRVGSISRRAGVPVDVDQWGWQIGFHPKPAHLNGTAATFEQARAEFARAWETFLPTCTEGEFLAHRRHRAEIAWKYAMWDAKKPLPTQTSSGRSHCFCGAEITIEDVWQHVDACHPEMGSVGTNRPIAT